MVLIAAVFLAALVFFAFRMLTTIVPAPHATNVHGAEAEQAHNCMNNSGPSMAFQEKDGTFHLICKGDKVYDVILKKDGEWYEKSSFAPKNGQLQEVLNWVRSKNVKTIYDLAQFKGLTFPY
jgi:hypothetical protein